MIERSAKNANSVSRTKLTILKKKRGHHKMDNLPKTTESLLSAPVLSLTLVFNLFHYVKDKNYQELYSASGLKAKIIRGVWPQRCAMKEVTSF